MNTLPTFQERFIKDFWEPTKREMEPIPIKATRTQILQEANKRASQTLGFQVEVKRRTLYDFLEKV